VRHGSFLRFDRSEIVADLRTAVRFIRSRAPEYGVNPERLGLWGGSAGGHLALLLGTTAEIGNAEASEDFELTEGRVAAVVAYFPITDLGAWADSHPRRVERFPAIDLSPEQARAYSPIHFASSDDPPTLIIHGDQDGLVPIAEGRSMYDALRQSDVVAKFVTLEGAKHGFTGEAADSSLAESVSWFLEHLAEK
jgi:acetyl esterase/lipase